MVTTTLLIELGILSVLFIFTSFLFFSSLKNLFFFLFFFFLIYCFFLKKLGWKGENVSTNEVAEIISTFPGVQEVNVYGVQIPGSDGRAGMCALVPEGNVDFVKLGQFVSSKLPSYSIPLFLRVLPKY